MPELTERVTVTGLTEVEWERALTTAHVPLPFGASHWMRWGGALTPDRRFVPLLVRWGEAGELLVPLCVSGADGQIGGFGYGMVCPVRTWCDAELPRFDALAERLCAATGLRSLRTLLPPTATVDGLDGLMSHWPGAPGRPTYLLDLTGGAESIWTEARGSVRTAVRRAEDHSVRADAAGVDDSAAVADLYRTTLRRNGVSLDAIGPDLAFLARGGADVLTRVARDADGTVQAVSAFAVAADAAFHVLQATSTAGRRTNAGHTAFFSAITGLAAAGVRRVDLGSAISRGQEEFKRNWGASARPTRMPQWPEPRR